jgi:ribosomal protein L37E
MIFRRGCFFMPLDYPKLRKFSQFIPKNMAIKVGRWDCPVCGHKGNLGPQTHCESCGSPRSPHVQFYLPDDAEEVKLKEKLIAAKAGADWECEYCGAENRAMAKVCHSCGNPRDLTEKQRTEKTIQIAAEPIDHPSVPIPEPPADKQGSGWWWKAALILIAIAVGLYYLVFKTHDEQVEVIRMRWERKTNLQHYTWVEESAWELPAKAQLIRKERAIHHTNQVPNGSVTKTRTVEVQTGTKKVKVGVKDLGNGYFEDIYEERPVYSKKKETYQETVYKDVPVFQTLYHFKIQRWKDEKPLQRQGEGNEPQNPKPKFADPENWKLGETKGYYWLTFRTANNKIDSLVASEDRFETWRKISVGQKTTVEKSALGVYFLPYPSSQKNNGKSR